MHDVDSANTFSYTDQFISLLQYQYIKCFNLLLSLKMLALETLQQNKFIKNVFSCSCGKIIIECNSFLCTDQYTNIATKPCSDYPIIANLISICKEGGQMHQASTPLNEEGITTQPSIQKKEHKHLRQKHQPAKKADKNHNHTALNPGFIL